MERLRYIDFELEIESKGTRYTARVLRSPVGEAAQDFALPLSEDKLENLVLKLGRARGGARRIDTMELEAARELGGALFESVFSGQVRDRLMSSLDEADRQEATGLRLKLRLEQAPELIDLPWEFLFDRSLNRFFAQSNQTPIVRYIEVPKRVRPLTVSLPLQILVMISSPDDYARLDVAKEKACLEKALAALITDNKIRLRFLENPTLAALQRSLREGNYHAFHFVGHGGFDKRTDQGVLVLEDAQGRGWLAGADRIGILLHDHRSLRLAVLNSCEGARNSRTDPFAGVATTLIRQGVPAVVAMQFEISDAAAITFADEFYSALAQAYPVDAAVAEARKAIYIEPNDVEWGTPVMYLRSDNGVLFDMVDETSDVPEPPATRKTPPAEELDHAKPSQPAIAPVETLPSPKTLARGRDDPATASPPATAPDGTVIATVIATLPHGNHVLSVSFSPDGSKLAAAIRWALIGATNTVYLWSIPQGKVLRKMDTWLSEFYSVAFSPDGATLASGSFVGNVHMWHVPEGTPLGKVSHGPTVYSVGFSPNGAMLASGAHDSSVKLWSVPGRKLLGTLKGHKGRVSSVAFSPDGTMLASAAYDHTVRLWSVPAGKLLGEMGHMQPVNSVVFSPDGAMMASASDDHSARLWSVPEGTRLGTLKEHSNSVSTVAFSPDGTVVATGSYDNTVRLWRVSERALLSTLTEHTDKVNSVAFSPDGTLLASGAADSTVRLWKLR